MNNTNDCNMENKTLILTGIRDNLLKPMTGEICHKTENEIKALREQFTCMTDEICHKTENEIKALRKKTAWIIGIAFFSLLSNLAVLTILLWASKA